VAQPAGTYALLLRLWAGADITVGRLGIFTFPAGYYVYVGSALGRGGLPARLARHGRQQKRMHWHIDYLLAYARIIGVQTDTSGERLECTWARKWLHKPGAQIIAPGFGASDCRCPAHLVYSESTHLIGEE
jgi:Uri superfamily endonuclease